MGRSAKNRRAWSAGSRRSSLMDLPKPAVHAVPCCTPRSKGGGRDRLWLLRGDRDGFGLLQRFQPRIDLLREQRQMVHRVLMLHRPGMAHHQKVRHSAAMLDEVDDLIVDLIGSAAEHYPRVDQIQHAARRHLDHTAVFGKASWLALTLQYTDIVLDR